MARSIVAITFLIFACSCTQGIIEKEDKQSTPLGTVKKVKNLKPYPLSICIVSGMPLDSIEEPVVINHEGQEIKFCCAGCGPKFIKKEALYLAKIAEAHKALEDTGPAKTE